jgi:hypothetical protein
MIKEAVSFFVGGISAVLFSGVTSLGIIPSLGFGAVVAVGTKKRS